MTNKKLGLLLAPLLPLTAIGIVEVARAIVVPTPVVETQTIVVHVPTPPPPPAPAPIEPPQPALPK